MQECVGEGGCVQVGENERVKVCVSESERECRWVSVLEQERERKSESSALIVH